MLSAKEGETGISTSGGRPAPSCKVQEKAPKSQGEDNASDYAGHNADVSMVKIFCHCCDLPIRFDHTTSIDESRQFQLLLQRGSLRRHQAFTAQHGRATCREKRDQVMVAT